MARAADPDLRTHGPVGVSLYVGPLVQHLPARPADQVRMVFNAVAQDMSCARSGSRASSAVSLGVKVVKFSKSVAKGRATWARTSAICSSPAIRRRVSTARTPAGCSRPGPVSRSRHLLGRLPGPAPNPPPACSGAPAGYCPPPQRSSPRKPLPSLVFALALLFPVWE